MPRRRRKAPGPCVTLKDVAGPALQTPPEQPAVVSAERPRDKQTQGCVTGPEARESHALTSRHRTPRTEHSQYRPRPRSAPLHVNAHHSTPRVTCGTQPPRTVWVSSNFRRWWKRLAFWLAAVLYRWQHCPIESPEVGVGRDFRVQGGWVGLVVSRAVLVVRMAAAAAASPADKERWGRAGPPARYRHNRTASVGGRGAGMGWRGGMGWGEAPLRGSCAEPRGVRRPRASRGVLRGWGRSVRAPAPRLSGGCVPRVCGTTAGGLGEGSSPDTDRQGFFAEGWSGRGTGFRAGGFEWKERLDNAFRWWVWILGSGVWSEELGSMILEHPPNSGYSEIAWKKLFYQFTGFLTKLRWLTWVWFAHFHLQPERNLLHSCKDSLALT